MQWAPIPRADGETVPPHPETAVRLLQKGTLATSELEEPGVARRVIEELASTR
ncbi:hypothetical protein [Planobispora longispora]|uniref:Uncharacterized protein n=1 Tax=Planobispora longispora TaxID=28887 RepID=A0A8J3RF91_9ACTN|nr:hypothetical protein [Planobispora longispora]BFE86969.1 hypothetical protein GCM10020093_095700 [Planobispora longispora]GIH74647.1 hypothetical protein Plo01_10760 [Planobispora longispora]